MELRRAQSDLIATCGRRSDVDPAIFDPILALGSRAGRRAEEAGGRDVPGLHTA